MFEAPEVDSRQIETVRFVPEPNAMKKLVMTIGGGTAVIFLTAGLTIVGAQGRRGAAPPRAAAPEGSAP
jgi:hypothetical protein